MNPELKERNLTSAQKMVQRCAIHEQIEKERIKIVKREKLYQRLVYAAFLITIIFDLTIIRILL